MARPGPQVGRTHAQGVPGTWVGRSRPDCGEGGVPPSYFHFCLLLGVLHLVGGLRNSGIFYFLLMNKILYSFGFLIRSLVFKLDWSLQFVFLYLKFKSTHFIVDT